MTVATRRRNEKGAATLETTGMAMLASLLVVAVLMVVTPQARIMGETVSYWICQVVTFGQGGCAPPSASPDAHVPTEPCVISQNGTEHNQKVSVLIFDTENGKRVEVSEMSNGEYRVSITDTEGAGVSVGAGGGISVTVNDTAVGVEAAASAGASLNLKSGEIYYTDAAGLPDVVGILAQDKIKDIAVGNNGPLRWIVDKGTEWTGISEKLPEPDAVFAQGGISMNASAVATGGVMQASAGLGAAKMLGTSTNRDGTLTVYLESSVQGEAGLQALGVDTTGNNAEFQGMDLSGEVEVLNAVTFDTAGNMLNVQTSVAMSGSASGVAAALFKDGLDPSLGNTVSGATVYQATLPINSQADQNVANNYLLAIGVSNLGPYANPVFQVNESLNFYAAAADRGQMTKLHYDIDSSTPFAVDASAELGVELGVSGSVKTDSMTINDAKYWDGADWVVWEECAA